MNGFSSARIPSTAAAQHVGERIHTQPLDASCLPLDPAPPTLQHPTTARPIRPVGRLAVVVPARDEALTLPTVLERLQDTLAVLANEYKIFVVADRCFDATAEVARLAGATVVEKTNPGGLGVVFREGVHAALEWRPDAIACIDADGQYTEEDLLRLVALLQSGVDLAIGNRLHRRPHGMPASRYLLNRMASLLVENLARSHVPDSQSGLRAFNTRVALIGLRRDFTYTQEQILRCSAEGFAIGFTPVSFGPRTIGESRLMRNSWHYAARALPALLLSAMESVRIRQSRSETRRSPLGADADGRHAEVSLG
jgi:glycosyltransferase involved in cell wall biosynthesis